jgi:hypothetical protein
MTRRNSQTITYGTFTNGKPAAQTFKEERELNFNKTLRQNISRNMEALNYSHIEHAAKEMNETGQRKNVERLVKMPFHIRKTSY